jgi:NHLM bacteriocin system ABC transporter ATP-binding protein
MPASRSQVDGMKPALTPAGTDTASAVLLSGGSNNPVMLDDSSISYRIREGAFDVFAVENSSIDSRRHYLFQLTKGDAAFGIDALSTPHVGLLLVGSLDSKLEVLDPGERLTAASCECWIRALSGAISDAPLRGDALTIGLTVHGCAAGEVLKGDPKTVFWIGVTKGQATLSDAQLPVPDRVRLPLSGALRLAGVTDIEIAVEQVATFYARDLEFFNIACQHALLARFRDDGPEQKAAPVRSADPLDSSLRRLAGSSGRRAPVRAGLAAEPLHAALGQLFEELAVEPIAKAFDRDLKSHASEPERLTAILSHHRLLSRSVLLRPGWGELDGPPLLAWLDEKRSPVALVFRRRRWFMLDGDVAIQVNDDILARLADDAVQIYPTLPLQPFPFSRLFGFGMVGGGGDLSRIGLCLMAGAVFASMVPVASRFLIDDALPHGDLSTTGLIIVGLFISVLARTVFESVKSVAMLRSELRLEGRLQPAMIARMINLPTSFYRSYSVGDIMDRVLGIQRARQLLSQHGAGAIIGAVFSLVSLVPIFFIDARLALVVFGLALLLGLVSAAITVGELRHERRRIVQKGKLDGFVLQVLMGISKLRASAAEPMAFERWGGHFGATLGPMIAAQRWANLQKSAQALLPELATIALYAMIVYLMKSDAAKALAAPGKDAAAAVFSAGAFVSLSAAVAQVMGSVTALADALTQTLGVVPLIERAKPIIASELDVPLADPERLDLRGDIDIRNVSFRYSEKSPLALDGLDLQIGKGEFVAIVGASGSGKSTLLRLLLGFEKPEQGDIFYDGCSIRRLAVSELRRQMGVVLQHGKLFSGSIHGNIVGQSGLGMNEAMAAARLVGLDRDIEAMPMGMHTVLLDGAAALSGGQRQRILIARALVGQPAILLLDEATSALDNRTQAVVTETLSRLAVTRIVIAHRLSTIEAADRIVVLEKGKVVEMGNFASLMAKDGRFAAHARRQII